MLLRSICAVKLKVFDFSADSNHEPDSNGEYTGATLEAGDLPELFIFCSAFMEDAWTIEFVSAIMFTILQNRKGSWGSINLVVSPYYTQCKLRQSWWFVNCLRPLDRQFVLNIYSSSITCFGRAALITCSTRLNNLDHFHYLTAVRKWK